MTCAIISNKTKQAQKDADGNPHIYENVDTAIRVCEEMNRKAFEQDGGDPLNPPPIRFRVVPW